MGNANLSDIRVETKVLSYFAPSHRHNQFSQLLSHRVKSYSAQAIGAEVPILSEDFLLLRWGWPHGTHEPGGFIHDRILECASVGIECGGLDAHPSSDSAPCGNHRNDVP